MFFRVLNGQKLRVAALGTKGSQFRGDGGARHWIRVRLGRFLSTTRPGEDGAQDSPGNAKQLRQGFGSFGTELQALNKARKASDLLRMSRDNNFEFEDWDE